MIAKGDGPWVEVLGAGGHASVVVSVVHRTGMGQVRVWYEQAPDPQRFPAGTLFEAVSTLPTTTSILLGMGDLRSRREWRSKFPAMAGPLVDPSAVIGHGVRLGQGVVVMPGVVVNPNATVDEDVILNTGCIIEHDCRIGQNTHIAPGALLGGAARVGSDCLVGTGAVLLPGVEVGHSVVVGAGAVVTAPVPDHTTVVGVPARIVSG